MSTKFVTIFSIDLSTHHKCMIQGEKLEGGLSFHFNIPSFSFFLPSVFAIFAIFIHIYINIAQQSCDDYPNNSH